MKKSFLVVAGLLLVAPAAWAGPPPGPEGSGNNVNTALNPPAAAPAPATATAPAQKAQIAPLGTGNNVSTALSTPAPAPAPARAPAPVAAPASGQAAQASSFNAGAYATAADCMTAASAANQPLGQCEGRKK
jgi:hypothetical protein